MSSLPPAVLAQVDERDQEYCRFCGKFLGERRVPHHILYGGDMAGMGGRRVHELTNLITLCSDWDNKCHSKVHADKHTWQSILLTLASGQYPGTTALQLQRWQTEGTTS